jgi:hypothetical protein
MSYNAFKVIHLFGVVVFLGNGGLSLPSFPWPISTSWSSSHETWSGPVQVCSGSTSLSGTTFYAI